MANIGSLLFIAIVALFAGFLPAQRPATIMRALPNDCFKLHSVSPWKVGASQCQQFGCMLLHRCHWSKVCTAFRFPRTSSMVGHPSTARVSEGL
jgi:hypothetical protein